MGIKKNIIIRNCYKDSVVLMQLSSGLETLENINSISLMMGTPANKKIMHESGLLTQEGESAGTNDLIVAVDSEDQKSFDLVLDKINEKIESTCNIDLNEPSAPESIDMALEELRNANFALISVPGQYAAREARKALENNLNVMIFSDNVSIEDEISLKKKAGEKGLLLMGPDCGTSVISGIPIGFANRVPQGEIGIAAASGTGLQEVMVTISKLGGGISHAIGTGGRDLSIEVGGMTMLNAIDFLQNDPSTKVIILISKPPHPEITRKIKNYISEMSKPVIICFIGSESASFKENNIYFADTLENAAYTAIQVLSNKPVKPTDFTDEGTKELIQQTKNKIVGTGKYIRGLYSGGTLADECISILHRFNIRPYSNTEMDPAYKLEDAQISLQHTIIDMGDDEFTKGRPHPMIDLTLRNRRIEEEAEKDNVAIILFDLVLGYGAAPNPAGAMQETLHKVKDKKILISSICGTDMDPQNYSAQVDILEKENVIILPSNAQASKFAAMLVTNDEN